VGCLGRTERRVGKQRAGRPRRIDDQKERSPCRRRSSCFP
jgi:hypothetical protein